jgi:hypothetical protein
MFEIATGDRPNSDLRDMRTHRTPHTIRAAALAAIVALGSTTSCGSDDNDVADTTQPEETAAADATATETSAGAATDEGTTDPTGEASGAAGSAAVALEEAVLRLEGVAFLEPELFVLDDPFENYDASIEMYTLTIDSLDELRTEFPDAADMSPEGSDTYEGVLEHLDAWAELATSSLDELDERRSELEPLTIEWAAALDSGDPGDPPQAYAVLVGNNPAAFEEFGQRCAEFAVSVDLAINCFGTPAPAADGSIEFTAGDVTFVVDPGAVDEYFVRPDFFGADLGPGDTMTISAPFPVRDPAAAIEDDATNAQEGAPLDQPVPWPDDIDEYLAASPFEAIDDVTVATPSGDFRRLTLAQDAVPALSFIELPPGPVVVRRTQPLVLWIGEIDSQTVIATLHAANAQSAETFTAQVDEALGTLRPIG